MFVMIKTILLLHECLMQLRRHLVSIEPAPPAAADTADVADISVDSPSDSAGSAEDMPKYGKRRLSFCFQS